MTDLSSSSGNGRDSGPTNNSPREIAQALNNQTEAAESRAAPPPTAPNRSRIAIGAGVTAAGAVAAIAAWFALSGPAPPPRPAPMARAVAVTKPPLVQPARRSFVVTSATEQQILDHVSRPAPNGGPAPVTVFHFIPNPGILVLDFASLRDQGLMLNRTAAFVEKAGLPHDHLLDDADLAAAIKASGDTPETYYYGHDYGHPAITRFFAEADRENIALSDQEQSLRDLLRQEGWFDANARQALISIPQAGADEHVTMSARATILRHELSHGEYFTNPAYAAFVHHFWGQILTSAERDHIRAYLLTLGYDTSLEEVMENEAQAYLMFTENPAFFEPSMVGMSAERLTEVRVDFHAAMPAGWLRDSLARTLPPPRPESSRAEPSGSQTSARH